MLGYADYLPFVQYLQVYTMLSRLCLNVLLYIYFDNVYASAVCSYNWL